MDDFNRWMEGTGTDYFLLAWRYDHSGGPPFGRIMEAFQLFGEEVIPNCQKLAKTTTKDKGDRPCHAFP